MGKGAERCGYNILWKLPLGKISLGSCRLGKFLLEFGKYLTLGWVKYLTFESVLLISQIVLLQWKPIVEQNYIVVYEFTFITLNNFLFVSNSATLAYQN